jgi:hypothetical protein
LMYWNSFDCARLAIGSNGQVLTVSAGAPAWSTSWTTVVKASDENRQSNTTLADDGALLVPLAANTNYIIRGEVFYNTPTTADFKFSFNGPASPSLVNIAHFGVDADGTAVGSPGSDEAYGVSTSATGAAGTFGWVKFSALIRNGANAGNFAFQWAQNSSVASNTTVRAGSHVEYRTV